jgi:hypothetical protein
MKTVAQISFRGGGLVVPARDQYDREVAFEHAEAYARRHGRVRLELNGNTMLIGLNGTSGHTCGSCGDVLGLLTYDLGTRHLCARCVRTVAQVKPKRDADSSASRTPLRRLVDPPSR